MTSWLERRVIAYAHQGGSFEGPSSTLFAIARALDRGATAIELDVHATRDRTVVVCHDESVDRTTNHRGEIAALDFEELRSMDNAYWWVPGDVVAPGRPAEQYEYRGRAPADRHFAVASLEEVSSAFPGVLLNLDLKRSAPDVEPYEELLASELRRLERTDSVMVASFHDAVIQAFRSYAPEVATSAATLETAAFYFSVLANAAPALAPVSAFQVPSSVGDVTVVDERFVESAHRSGVAVHVWTINDVDEMNRLLDLGVDGIISDTPTRLAELLRERNCAWDGVL